jgi:hypothetical protein
VVADHKRTSQNARGFVISTGIRDGWIEAVMQLIGSDAAIEASRNRVSPGIRKDFVDGQGRKYPGLFLEHLALTPIPVADSQGPLLAASRGAEDDERPLLLSLSAAVKDHFMKPEHKARALMQLSEAGETIDDSAGDDEIMSKLLDNHRDQADDIMNLAARDQATQDYCRNLSMEEDEVQKLRDAVASADNADVSPRSILLSRVDPDALSERHIRLTDKAARLDDKGWTPAQRQELAAVLLGPSDAPNVFCLSRESSDSACVADAVLDVLMSVDRNAPSLGEASLMSRQDPRKTTPAAEQPKANPWLAPQAS